MPLAAYLISMTDQSDWHVVSRRGKHKETVAKKPRVTSATQSGLAALPSEILVLVFRYLYNSPAAAANLAQTCRTLASEYHDHRSHIITQRLTDLCPVYDIPDLGYSKYHADIDIWWRRGSSIRQLHALSEQPGAIERMWDAAFSRLREDLHVKGHCYAETHLHGSRHCKSITCHIQLQSSTHLYLPAWCLREHFMVSAAAALKKTLRERNSYIYIRVKIYRVWGDDLCFLLAQTFCCNDETEKEYEVSESESSCSYISWKDLFNPEA